MHTELSTFLMLGAWRLLYVLLSLGKLAFLHAKFILLMDILYYTPFHKDKVAIDGHAAALL